MWLCAWLSSHGHSTALRLARGLSLFFLVLFLFRGWKIREVEEKQYLFITSVIYIQEAHRRNNQV
jgi:hypothetical protein